ncbi:MAG: cation-translocating P-type ATPase [Fuerstiella sp.]
MKQFHTQSAADVLQHLAVSSEAGLSATEVIERRTKFGRNELVERGQRTAGRILWEQLTGAMVILLVGAAVVSAFLHEYIDALAIVTIIVLNAVLGFVQDYRAEQALAALKQMAVPLVRVRRNGAIEEVAAGDLVPGDIVLLEAGNAVPADCRLVESFSLKSQEAALTGESEAVLKTTDPIADADAAIGDQHNMVWMGTTVTYGHGVAVVVTTGMETQLGHIADSLQTVEAEPTPLQQRLARLGRTLAIVAIGIVAVVFVFGVLRGEDARLMLMTALSLAVAVVPEGLPAVATVALALGARRMVQRQALIRKLPAVETLGSVTVICSDKTGTLTQNRMTVTVLDVAGRRETLAADRPQSSVGLPSSWAEEDSTLPLLLTAAALCNDAELQPAVRSENDSTAANVPTVIGDPTEVALLLAAADHGLARMDLQATLPRVDEVPFDSDRKMMTTVHRRSSDGFKSEGLQTALAPLSGIQEGQLVAFTKGAADRVVQRCRFAWSEDKTVELDDHWRARIESASDELAAQGTRVLGLAFRILPEHGATTSDSESIEAELVFLGLMGMIDPPRSEARDAVERCRTAGIRPIMITGDHPLTALHIARQLGIADDQSTVVTGVELGKQTPQQFNDTVARSSVYARVSPRDKLNIVRTLQQQDQVVAMTGDGVNDAPALKQAHIGVAMGKVGTDVSKEASDMILLDDNFATIVNAVEQGRIVYDNIRKFVKYTMTSNAGEVLVMLLGPLLGMPLALLPLQILWINLVTDGLPGLALALEPAERNTMKRRPYPLEQPVIHRPMLMDIAWIGLLMAVVSLAMGYWYWSSGDENEAHWRTMVFTVLTLSQMGNALAIRSDRDTVYRLGLFSNPSLIGAILLTFSLQMAVIYIAPLQKIFQTTGLTLAELLSCLALSTIVFAAIELKKVWRNRQA